MAQKAETRLVNKIRDAMKERYGPAWKGMKIHGSAMQETGLPDIIGCLDGRFLALEVKMPGEQPSDIQAFRLAEFSRAGATAAVVYSVEQALELADGVLRSTVRIPLRSGR